uniref:hypothetical protein n=1 Tax=Acetatifactor sp. TaxID=1872090 RepID=UPI00405766F2
MEGLKKYTEPPRYGGVSKMYRCPVCDKDFFVPFQTKGGGRTNWVYKRRKKKKSIYYCSYHCYMTKEEVNAE